MPDDVLDAKPLEGQKSMVPILRYWRCAGRSGGSVIFLTYLLVSCALRACSRFGIRANLDILSVRRNQISSKGLRRGKGAVLYTQNVQGDRISDEPTVAMIAIQNVAGLNLG